MDKTGSRGLQPEGWRREREGKVLEERRKRGVLEGALGWMLEEI